MIVETSTFNLIGNSKFSEKTFLLTDLWCYNPELSKNSEQLNVQPEPIIGSRVNKVNPQVSDLQEKTKSSEERIIRSGVIFMIEKSDIENVKILVVKGQMKNGKEGVWSIPKGRPSFEGESNETCALREVYEETGIKLERLENLPKCKISHNVYYKYITTENEFTEFKITDISEVETVEWKTIAELRKMNCNKDLRSLLLYPTKSFSYHKILFN